MVYQFFNMFFYSRTVVIDKNTKVIRIIIKRFWFVKSSEIIPFNHLEYIDISHREVGEDFGMTPDGFGS